MNKYLILTMLTSCARPVIDIYEGTNGQDGSNGISCTISNSTISCTDRTSIEIHNGEDGQDGAQGTPGQNGANGINGVDGFSLTYSLTEASEEQCSSGGSILLLGLDINDNLVVDNEDTNIQSALLCNGLDGTNGLDGSDGQDGLDGNDAPPTPFTPVGLIDPCGDAPGLYDEVFLQMYDGTLLASFSDNANGKNTRFSVLVPGNYHTTDNDNCGFTVDNNGDIVNESHQY